MTSKKKYPLGPYGLSIVLAVLFLTSWILQTYTGWKDCEGEQKTHGQSAALFGDGGYIWHWGAQTMENWQSEFLQLLTFVALTSVLVHKGSHESKDTDDEVNERLTRIERKLDDLASPPPPAM